MKSLAIAVILFLSPLWPFGENPVPNAPFLIVNKHTHQLAYVDRGTVKVIYPVATGATNQLTPNGLHTVIVKAKDPYYRKKNIPGGSPDNPLGSRWIGFDAKDTDGRIYGVHGTNQPESIGASVSAGCIRMENKHVEALFDKIPIGTKLLITETTKSFQEIAAEHNAFNLE
ncbi:L,D-transpeptidase catalytic domain [Sediminibacillus albus]|uniref:L,D-transpeptidase catalytic domain n=2 Tax=Sediminibacillus albus TaxID=407036 RepID=A0A1G8VGU7_9BACI|nr:L,D-transpeptidase catalytic domain [Sediminibacillus albus]